MKGATHFNPVDLVCGVKRFDGSKFDLKRFVDPSTGFISSKSSGGRELRAQELAGLWNGAMAHWNTIFCRCADFDLLAREGRAGFAPTAAQ